MSDSFDQDDGYGTEAVSFDSDGDGYAETTLADTSGDGIVDAVVVEDPYTGGVAVARDLDGDGLADVVAVDYDGDGLIDYAVVDESAPEGPFTEESTELPTEEIEEGPFVEVPEAELDEGTDTEDQNDDDGIHGDPRSDIEYHQAQPGPVDCLPTSVAMVISEVTGTEVAADDLVSMANELEMMNEQGMAAPDALTLLENHGVDAELTSGTVDGLRASLDSGDPIIVGIDAADLYSGGGGPFDPGMESGHAVVVTGIDDGPPGVVYINDPGFPDGGGVEIPLDDFVDAWEDSDNTMVVATTGDDLGSDGTVATAEDSGAAESIRRILLLPLTFIVRDL